MADRRNRAPVRLSNTHLAILAGAGLILGLLARVSDSQQWSREITSYLGLWWGVIVATSMAVSAGHIDRSVGLSLPRIRASAAAPSLVMICALVAYYFNSSVAMITILFWVLVALVVAPIIAGLTSLVWIRPNEAWSPLAAGVLGAMPIAEALSIATTSASSARWGAVWFDVVVGAALSLLLLARTQVKGRTLAVISVVVALGPIAFGFYADVYRWFGSL